MGRKFQRFGGATLPLTSGEDEEPTESCGCMRTLCFTNVMLIAITGLLCALVVLKAVEDTAGGSLISEGMDHVRYFRHMTEWGQGVFHNASVAIVDPENPVKRQTTAETTMPGVDGSEPEVAVVRELLELLVQTNALMDRVEREESVERATSLLALVHDVGTSEGAQLAGTMLRQGLSELHVGNMTHSQNGTEAFVTRLVHIATNADDLSHEMAQRAGPILDKTDGMLDRVEEAQMLEYVQHILTVSSSLLQELRAANATEKTIGLLEKADVVLDETRQSLEDMLGNGLTLSLGGGKK